MTPTNPVGGPLLNQLQILARRLSVIRYSTRWLILATISGILAGSASAILLISLDWATNTRESHRWIIALLPLAGLSVGLIYHYLGRCVEGGNNLILDEINTEIHTGIHAPRTTIPARMTPRTLLMAGISAGFASVFGTPLSGAVFGLEVLTIGNVGYDAIFPCFVAAFAGDYTVHLWRVHHTIYTVTQQTPLNPTTMLSAIAAGITFGLTALLFARSTHAITRLFKRHISYPPLRPFLGGIVVALAVFAIGTTKYIGLGIPTILAAFSQHLPRYDFAAKFAFTSLTLGAGFKGGEVTPLFFIGATLGNALSSILPLPSSLLAAMGFAAVFAGAANTPIAGSLMALELFGPEAGAFAAIACVTSYLFSGHKGIYHAQRLGTRKHPSLRTPDSTPQSPESRVPTPTH